MNKTKLTDFVGKNLPNDVNSYLPIAHENADLNVKTIQIRRGKDVAELRRQLREVVSAKYNANNRMQRLRFLVSQYSEIFSSKTACASGCSHCCNIDVAVSLEEVKVISKAIRKPLKTNVKTYGIEQSDAQKQYVGSPCIFLQAGKCSIYSNRPLMCMTLVNMDNTSKLCELRDGISIPVPYLNMMEIHQIMIMIIKEDSFADIREWFDVN